MARFHFRAHYMTRGGNLGSVTYILEADDISQAMEEGLARAHRRKSYAGKMDASCVQLPE